jgi:hypothetical protein
MLKVLDFPTGVSTNINQNQIWLMCSSPNLSVNEDHHARDFLEVRLATPLLAAQYFRLIDGLMRCTKLMTT